MQARLERRQLRRPRRLRTIEALPECPLIRRLMPGRLNSLHLAKLAQRFLSPAGIGQKNGILPPEEKRVRSKTDGPRIGAQRARTLLLDRVGGGSGRQAARRGCRATGTPRRRGSTKGL